MVMELACGHGACGHGSCLMVMELVVMDLACGHGACGHGACLLVVLFDVELVVMELVSERGVMELVVIELVVMELVSERGVAWLDSNCGIRSYLYRLLAHA